MSIQATGSRPAATLPTEDAAAAPPAATTAAASAPPPQATSAYEGNAADAQKRDAAVGNTASTPVAESRESIGRRMDNLSPEQRQQTLQQAGVKPEWLNAASAEQQREALIDVEQARQRGGQANIQLPTVTVTDPGINNDSTYVAPTETQVEGSASFHTDAQGRVAPSADGVHTDLTSTTELRAHAEREARPWPGGKPEDRVVSRFTPGADPNSSTQTATRQDKMETVLAALPPEARAETRGLMEGRLPADTPGNLGVTEESLDKAFNDVLSARNTPGTKDLKLELRTARDVDTGGDSGFVRREESPLDLQVKVDVSADGKVNGEPLGVDVRARLSSEVKTVPEEFKDQALRDAGISEDWMNRASPLQKDNALAQLREASTKPGTHQLDFGFDYQQEMGGDSGGTYKARADATVRLEVSADGKVNGKQPIIEKALATQLQMESLPMADKRALMGSLGFDAEAQRNVNPAESASLLTRAAMVSDKPGEHRLETHVAGQKYALAMKVGADGKLEGAGAAKVPPPPRKSFFQRVLQPILTIASIIPSPIQPFAAIANGVIGGAQALKNGNILGAVASFAGAGAGVAGLAGNTALAGTLGSVSAVTGSVNGAIQAVKTGDVAGLFSSVVSGASAMGNLAGTPISSDLTRLGTVVSTANAVSKGDFLGALGGVVSLAQSNRTAAAKDTGDTTAASPAAAGTEPAAAQETNDGPQGAEAHAVAAPGEIETRDLPPLDPEAGPTRHADAAPGVGATANRPESRTVARGDTLSRIAQETLGDAKRWPEIYEYNKDVLGTNPNNVRAGMELRIPPEDYTVSAARQNQLHNQAHIAPPVTQVVPSLASLPPVPEGFVATAGVDASGRPTVTLEATGPKPTDADKRAEQGVAAAKWVSDATALKWGVIDHVTKGGAAALGLYTTGLSAVLNAAEAHANTDSKLTTGGRNVQAVLATAVDIAGGTTPLGLVDTALKVFDPLAKQLTPLGNDGVASLSGYVSPLAVVAGAANNITAFVDNARGNSAALDWVRQQNLSGANGAVLQGFARIGEAVSDWIHQP